MNDLMRTLQIDSGNDAKPIPSLEVYVRNLTGNGRVARIVSSYN